MSIFSLSLHSRRVVFNSILLFASATSIAIVIQNSMGYSMVTRGLVGFCLFATAAVKFKNLLYLSQEWFGIQQDINKIQYYSKHLSPTMFTNINLYSALSFSCLGHFLIHTLAPNLNIYAKIVLQWPLYSIFFYSLMHSERICDDQSEDVSKYYDEKKLTYTTLFYCTAIPLLHCITYSPLSLLVGVEVSHVAIIALSLFSMSYFLNYDIKPSEEVGEKKEDVNQL